MTEKLDTTQRRWDLNTPAASMTDADISAELTDREREWDELRVLLEESGGAAGSPGEWLWERMGELEHEQKRRAAHD